MSGILRLESLTKGNTLKQGDKTPLKYRLFDADGEKLNIAGKSAKVRLVYPDFLTIGYEKDGLTVAQDDTVTFTIDNVIPSRIYHVEIIVDDQFIFPSRADESKFTVDKSSLGTETNIVEIVGVEAVARKATGMMKQDEEFIDDMTENVISDSKVQSFAQGIDAKATNALSLSESADTLSKSVQEQFNQVVIDGDSSVEAAQARVDASGQTNPTLKARLDKEHNEVTEQLAQTDDTLKSESLKSSQIQAQTRNVSDLKTMVTFIDDDGYNGVLDILKPMFTARGVPYVIALRGDAVILQTEEKREQLRDLQNNHGWEMASHTMTHIHLNSSTDEEIEEDSINFLKLMHDCGLDVESVVYPWGENGNTSVISKYYRAGFGTANGVNNDIKLDDYNIGREMLGNSSSRDTEFFKDMIDSIDGEPRWLVFMTHVSDPATNVQQIEDVVDYVISKNIPIVTAREGLKHYGSVLNSRGNTLVEPRYLRLKSNGIIQSNRYHMNFIEKGDNGIVITGNSLPSHFDVGITTKHITGHNQGELPMTGMLETTKTNTLAGYTHQFLFGAQTLSSSRPAVLYRKSISLTGSDEWGDWVDLIGINYQPVTEESPITDYQYGESVRLVTGWILGNGTVKTIRAAVNAGYGRQLYFPASNDKIYTRRVSGGGWSDWVEISPPTQTHTILSTNALTGDDLIGAYPNNVSVMSVNFAGSTGFPNAGLVTTYRVGGNGWNYQIFSTYNSFEMYKRYVKTDGSWSDWKQVQMME